jgi:hypothetical protein
MGEDLEAFALVELGPIGAVCDEEGPLAPVGGVLADQEPELLGVVVIGED